MTLKDRAVELRQQVEALEAEGADLRAAKEEAAAAVDAAKDALREWRSRRDPAVIEYEDTLRRISAQAGAAEVVPIVLGEVN